MRVCGIIEGDVVCSIYDSLHSVNIYKLNFDFEENEKKKTEIKNLNDIIIKIIS